MDSQDPLATAVRVPTERFVRWIANFETRHGTTQLTTEDGCLRGTAQNGSTFTARLPFGAERHDAVAATDFAAAATPPADWGVLLVRKGGFAIARLHGRVLVESKLGRRHVQGRTKAGGQSQQRFARRRDNQARRAFEAAADHAARLLIGLGPVVLGGDRQAVAETLQDSRLAEVIPLPPWLSSADPRREILAQAILDAQAIAVEVTNRA
ncbi:MAG: acVLRF1 family peptidyl-tRNA hydrolase [Nocardioides sp.]